MERIKNRTCLYCGHTPRLLHLSENTVVMRCMDCWSNNRVRQSIGQGLNAEQTAINNWESGYQLQEFGPNLSAIQ